MQRKTTHREREGEYWNDKWDKEHELWHLPLPHMCSHSNAFLPIIVFNGLGLDLLTFLLSTSVPLLSYAACSECLTVYEFVALDIDPMPRLARGLAARHPEAQQVGIPDGRRHRAQEQVQPWVACRLSSTARLARLTVRQPNLEENTVPHCNATTSLPLGAGVMGQGWPAVRVSPNLRAYLPTFQKRSFPCRIYSNTTY